MREWTNQNDVASWTMREKKRAQVSFLQVKNVTASKHCAN